MTRKGRSLGRTWRKVICGLTVIFAVLCWPLQGTLIIVSTSKDGIVVTSDKRIQNDPITGVRARNDYVKIIQITRDAAFASLGTTILMHSNGGIAFNTDTYVPEYFRDRIVTVESIEKFRSKLQYDFNAIYQADPPDRGDRPRNPIFTLILVYRTAGNLFETLSAGNLIGQSPLPSFSTVIKTMPMPAQYIPDPHGLRENDVNALAQKGGRLFPILKFDDDVKQLLLGPVRPSRTSVDTKQACRIAEKLIKTVSLLFPRDVSPTSDCAVIDANIGFHFIK